MNSIIIWIYCIVSELNRYEMLILAVIMAMMVPLSMHDRRKGMTNDKAVIIYSFMPALFNGMFGTLFSLWWVIALSIPETLILLLLFMHQKIKIKRNNQRIDKQNAAKKANKKARKNRR